MRRKPRPFLSVRLKMNISKVGIDKRFDELIELGEKALEAREGKANINRQLALTYGTASLDFLEKICGTTSPFVKTFERYLPEFHNWYAVNKTFGALLGAKNTYTSGYLFSIKSLTEAEVFDDLLEQAEQLYSKGYFQAALIITGCVLEDAMRRLCDKKNIALPPKVTINRLNDELAKKGVYNAYTKKAITAHAQLRNDAAHALRSNFTKAETEDMIKFVRTFMETHYL